MSLRVLVANLPGDAGEETVRNLFSKFGRVQAVQITRTAGVPLVATSSCLVELRPGSNAGKAIHTLNGQYLRGRILNVEALSNAYQ